MNSLGSRASFAPLVVDRLRVTELALDEARSHLLDYADTTDKPAPGIVEIADIVDEIMAAQERIACKVDGLPECQP